MYSDTYCESSDMCRDENLDDVHSIKNGRFHEWFEDYKMSDWIEVGPVEAFIKVRMLGGTQRPNVSKYARDAPNGFFLRIRSLFC